MVHYVRGITKRQSPLMKTAMTRKSAQDFGGALLETRKPEPETIRMRSLLTVEEDHICREGTGDADAALQGGLRDYYGYPHALATDGVNLLGAISGPSPGPVRVSFSGAHA